MAKSKPQESLSNLGGSKRKKLRTSEREVCMEETMEVKRKKTEAEEPPISASSSSSSSRVQGDVQTGTKPKKAKQPTEHTLMEKRHKKTRLEIAEPTTEPPVTLGEEEEEDLSPEERRVLERKMKKILKKNKLKTEGNTEEKVDPSKPIASQQALDYLTCWSENRREWRFQKTRQTWLLQHMFDSQKVPDQSFSVLLSYLEGLRGAARDTTVQKAEALVQEQGEDQEDPGDQGDQGDQGEARRTAHRAREVIQLLS